MNYCYNYYAETLCGTRCCCGYVVDALENPVGKTAYEEREPGRDRIIINLSSNIEPTLTTQHEQPTGRLSIGLGGCPQEMSGWDNPNVLLEHS